MNYPDGAIKSFEELLEHNSWVWVASKHFKLIYDKELVGQLSVSKLKDYNVLKLNRYNDWFVFADQDKAKNWANTSMQQVLSSLPASHFNY